MYSIVCSDSKAQSLLGSLLNENIQHTSLNEVRDKLSVDPELIVSVNESNKTIVIQRYLRN